MSASVKNDDGKFERKFVVNKIKKLRAEWQQAIGIGGNLIDTHGSVAMLLADICNALELTPAERIEAIGSSQL